MSEPQRLLVLILCLILSVAVSQGVADANGAPGRRDQRGYHGSVPAPGENSGVIVKRVAEHVEFETLDWVDWFSKPIARTHRSHPPADFEGIHC